MMEPDKFVQKWAASALKESASYTEHFADVCRLVGHPTPAEKDPSGEFFTYQPHVQTADGRYGFADVWYDRHFAMEYKSKGKDLDSAYQQLQRYRENLNNPPLLVVCDMERWEIHTNWPGTETKVYQFTNGDLLNPVWLERVRQIRIKLSNERHGILSNQQQ